MYDCLIISTKPVTEISEVSFKVICQTLLKLGIASLNICGIITLKKWTVFFKPKTFEASNCPLSIDWIAPLKTSVEYAPEIIPIANDPVINALISIYSLYPNIDATYITAPLPPKKNKYITNNSGTPLIIVV